MSRRKVIEDEYESAEDEVMEEAPQVSASEDEAVLSSSEDENTDFDDDDEDEEEEGGGKAKRSSKKTKVKRSEKPKKISPAIYQRPEDLLEAVEVYQALQMKGGKGKETLNQPEELKIVKMRDYQLEGLTWMADLHQKGHGGILADEMGLGKTLQTISFLLHLRSFGEKGPFLVIAPLSVMDNWKNELTRFAPTLEILHYMGDKEARQELRDTVVSFVNSLPKAQRADPPFTFSVVLTTYEMVNLDFDFLHQFKFKYMVVDEAARLKNSQSQLYQNLEGLNCAHRLLLTGTPVQNNLVELHALLHFVKPDIFCQPESFQKWFAPKEGNRALQILHKVIKPFLLRRTKEEVLKELPEKREFTLYVGLTAIQKDMYKGLLMKDTSVFDGKNKTSLMNILSQLRKCVNHPYLFDGIEPEPFELGDHLVQASGKLSVLDTLLPYLKRKGHRILLFSQMTRVLDIIQDYLFLRGYAYERLDGSVRGEERFLAVKNFNDDPETFVFLLSTRAGGVGLNLTSADTVIFFDSDFNPQADLQAAARAHRIGQKKEVQIIRLVCRDTVEEIILKRAAKKLKLSSSVMTAGLFASPDAKVQATIEKWQSPDELLNILKFGMDNLLENLGDDKTLSDNDFDQIFSTRPEDIRDPNDLPDDDDDVEGDDTAGGDSAASMYIFKGEDYSSAKTRVRRTTTEKSGKKKADDEAFRKLAEEARKFAPAPKSAGAERRAKATSTLTPDELEELREEAEIRKQLKKEADLQKKEQKKQEQWALSGYHSSALPPPPQITASEGSSDKGKGRDLGDDEGADEASERAITYVTGDVTHPTPTQSPIAIIVNCVDNSGSWGSGGVFTALNKLSPFIGARYEDAGSNEDLHLGDVHLERLEELEGALASENRTKLWIANIVAQKRDKKGVSGIQLPSLEEAFKRMSALAKSSNASVHFPRIGQRTPNFNWYGTERLIRKWFCACGIPTYIYYFARKRKHQDDDSASGPSFYSPPQTLSLPDDTQDFPSSPPSAERQKKARITEEDSSLRESSPPLMQLQPKGSGSAGESSSSSSSAPNSLSLSLEGSPLLDIFTGMMFYFSGVPKDVVSSLTRKAVAFDGEVAKALDKQVTHILCDNDGLEDDGLALVVAHPQVRVVTVSWLKDSIAAKKALDPQPYSLVE